ncbi:uncharacterized protein [Rutidosis leptorrhynchoides]|uniref:uncharacterized protein n=1 Tax=Rutidosis leptorrhynchoides TaxID=125765 RepID=UPI003A9962A2
MVLNTNSRNCSVWMWSSIQKNELEFRILNINVPNSFTKKRFNGRETLIWKDLWLDNQLLCERFGRLFRLDANEDSTLAERMTITEKDMWTLTLQNNGCFSSSALNKIRNEHLLPPPINRSPTMRNNALPQKIGVFIWRAHMGRLPIRVELDKRGTDLDWVLCALCKNEIETGDRVLRSCTFAKDIWKRVLSWWKNNSQMYSSVADMFRGMKDNQASNEFLKIWQTIEWVVGYSLWKKRNSKLFRRNMLIAPVVFNEIQSTNYQWILNRSKKLDLDWNQWLLNPDVYDDHG